MVNSTSVDGVDGVAGEDRTNAELGIESFWIGDFARLDQVLERSIATLGPEPWDDETAARFVHQRALAGALCALRGDGDGAEETFARSIAHDGGDQVRAARIMALVLRALFASDSVPERARDDVAQVRTLAADLGPVAGVAISGVADGWALARLDRTDEAVATLRPLTTSLPTEVGCALAALRLAEVLLLAGDRRSARESVDQARETYLSVGAHYWGARSALLTGAIERDRAGRWLRLARELSLPDPAYDRLFLPIGALRIEPGVSPAVRRDGEPVRFLTRHAEVTLRMLAAAGVDGVSVDEITELFWPDAPTERQRARLRTLLWQVRNSLGADAWRVQRNHDIVVFDADGVELVGLVRRSAIADAFTASRGSRT